MSKVGIVIVSHSPKVAEGAADMVRQMVGKDVPLAWTGGDTAGELGTSFEAITEASIAHGRKLASRYSSTLAGPKRIARWRSRCLPRTNEAGS